MGICKILIKMKGKLKTKQIITNKHTRVSVFFSCVVFSDVIFLRNLKSRYHCASCFYKWSRCKMKDSVYTYYSNYRVHWFMIWHYPGSWASIQLNSKYAIQKKFRIIISYIVSKPYEIGTIVQLEYTHFFLF